MSRVPEVIHAGVERKKSVLNEPRVLPFLCDRANPAPDRSFSIHRLSSVTDPSSLQRPTLRRLEAGGVHRFSSEVFRGIDERSGV